MNTYYTFPTTLAPSPQSTVMHTPDFDLTYNTPSPEYASSLDAFQHTQYIQHVQHIRYTQHNPSNHHHYDHSRNHSHSPRPGSEPDFDFAHCLRSIHGTGTSPGQGRGPEVEGQTESEAVVAETIVRARKSWKTVKGRSEPVWPPHLEKALVQALLQYKPHDARYTRALGRFPKRNRYISDYIFAATGIRRSPKQVGSRLQQLKDVSCGKMLLKHVASWSQAPSTSVSASGSPSGLDLPLEPHHVLDVTINDTHGLASGSEGSESPVSPFGGVDPAACFVPSPASSAPVLDPYAIHMQLGFPQADWFTYDQCIPIPSQI